MVSLNALVLLAAVSGVGETVLLEFTADRCVHCRNMEPTIRRLQADGYPVRQIDVTRSPLWAENYRVRGVPCFVMLADGQVVDRVEGYTSRARLLRMFDAAGFRLGGSAHEQVRGQSPDRRAGGFRLAELLPGRKRVAEQRDRSPGAPQPVRAGSASGRSEAGPAASVRVGASSDLTPEQLAANATVRLKVEDPRGYSFGTGTIIDTHGEEALVVTCGHIFRESGGKGPITVDLFVGGTPRSVPGQLVTYDANTNDIGLVSIRPGVPVAPVPVAPPRFRPARGLQVFSIGCNNGRTPSLRRSYIAAVNRYLGPPNIEVAGMPVNGRSGGGLFTSDGMLIGVCNAADDQDDEGIYAALGVIHQKLAEIGQSRIFQRTQNALADRGSEPLGTKGPEAQVSSAASPSPLAHGASPAASGAWQDDVELICILRSRSGAQRKTETIVLDRPSADFLEQLKRESRSQDARAPRAPSGERAGLAASQFGPAPARPARSSGPVLRAQSRDR